MTLPIETNLRTPRVSGASFFSILLSPLAISFAVLVACVLLLALPITLPVGPFYWDVVIFIDGGWRVLSGQTPSVDFFAPVGPLGYWLYAAGMKLFPQAQPVLLSQWMLLPVTLVPLLPMLTRIDGRSRPLALALFLPFLVFQLLPTNVEQYSSYPSVDGFGIYNRHVVHLLYALTVALVFERRQRMLLFVIGWTCTALFLTKITGFLSAGMLCAFAFAAGRVRLSTALGAVALFAAALGALEAVSGVVSAYVRDIALLVGMNEGVLLSRFIQASSIHFGIFASGCLLTVALLVVDQRSVLADAVALARRPLQAEHWTHLLDRDAFWLAAALFAGLFFETQNTGGHAFVFVWPLLARIGCNAARHSGRGTVTILLLLAATAIPPAVNVLHRTARALVGQVMYEKVPAGELKALDSVTQRPELIERAERMIENYVAFPASYQSLADAGQLPTFTLYSELDFQAVWLMAASEGVEAIRAFEAANNVRFDTIMSLNFANPFPYALGRQGTPFIAIGADPSRAVPPPSAEVVEAVRRTDLVLLPLCPVTAANESLRAIYAEGLRDHVTVRLSRCWTGYIRPDLAASR